MAGSRDPFGTNVDRNRDDVEHHQPQSCIPASGCNLYRERGHTVIAVQTRSEQNGDDAAQAMWDEQQGGACVELSRQGREQEHYSTQSSVAMSRIRNTNANKFDSVWVSPGTRRALNSWLDRGNACGQSALLKVMQEDEGEVEWMDGMQAGGDDVEEKRAKEGGSW